MNLCCQHNDAVTALLDVLRAPGLLDRVRVLAGTPGVQRVSGVEVLEEISHVQTAKPYSLVLLTQSATQRVEAYRLDMALRVGLHRRVTAIMLTGSSVPSISRTGRDLSTRGGPAVLSAMGPIAELVIAITRGVEGSPSPKLQALFDLTHVLQESIAEGVQMNTLLQRATEVTGQTFDTVRPHGAHCLAVQVVSDGRAEMELFSLLSGDHDEDQARGLALQLVGDSAARLIAETSRAEYLPMLSQGELLTELLSVDEAHAEPLLRRARGLGIPIDGWHVVARLDLENLLDVVNHNEIAAYELREDLVRRMMIALRGGRGSWHHARSRQDLLFIHTDRHDPGPRAAHGVADMVDQVLSHQLGQRVKLVIRCGVGSGHSGPQGLRASALESRASVAQARLHGVTNHPVVFDAAGMRRGLIDWYTSAAARESAKLLLAPFDQLDMRGRDTAIRTLAVYLDAGGSLAQAAATLSIHRNAVAYRIKRALSLLGVDVKDPEQRLMLHLACRAELLSMGS